MRAQFAQRFNLIYDAIFDFFREPDTWWSGFLIWPVIFIIFPAILYAMLLWDAPHEYTIPVVCFWIFMILLREGYRSLDQRPQIAYLEMNARDLRDRLFPDEKPAPRFIYEN